MPDDVDVANDMAEKMLRVAIEAARGIRLVIGGNGVCLSCGEVVVMKGDIIPRWCDVDCRYAYEKERKNNGSHA